MDQLSYVRQWGARFMVPIPEARVYGGSVATVG